MILYKNIAVDEEGKRIRVWTLFVKFGFRKVFYVLYSAVMRPIPDTDEKAHERISLIKKMITALEKHGLTESVLRYGFADDIAVFLISGVILNKIGLPDSMVSRWRNILGIEEDGKDCSWFLNDIHRFKIWASTASMNDLIGFIPPSKDEWDNLNLAPMEDLSVVVKRQIFVWRQYESVGRFIFT